jgi:hypothetical protein
MSDYNFSVYVACVGEKRNVCMVFMEKPEGKRPLGGPRCRWEDNTKIDLREVRWGYMDLIHLAQDGDQWSSLVNTVMKFRLHKTSEN